MAIKFVKDPDAVLDYELDWTKYLQGDTITDATYTAVEDGITVNSHSFTDSTAIVWLSGGTAGVTYHVTCRITTAAGRTDDRTLQIQVKEL